MHWIALTLYLLGALQNRRVWLIRIIFCRADGTLDPQRVTLGVGQVLATVLALAWPLDVLQRVIRGRDVA